MTMSCPRRRLVIRFLPGLLVQELDIEDNTATIARDVMR